jgi:molybdopterin converting factor small subunit
MARVSTIAQSVRDLAGGRDHFEVEACTVRALLDALDVRYPGLGVHVRQSMVIAIDGDIRHNAWNDTLAPDAEVVLVPGIVAG